MKFKVLVYDLQNNPENGSFAFYTYVEADGFCRNWVQLDDSHRAFLWNGEIWSQYLP